MPIYIVTDHNSEPPLIYVAGDTYNYVDELFNAGLEFSESTGFWNIVEGVSDIYKLEELSKTSVVSPKTSRFAFWFTPKVKNYYVTGNTFQYKAKLANLGGKWNPKTKTWMIPKTETNLEKLTNLQFKILQKAKNAESFHVEQLKKKKAYRQMLQDNKEEIEAVTKLAFLQDPDRWWPLTEKSPQCACGCHVIWHYYELFEKDEQRIRIDGRGLECPKCHTDWTR